MAGWGADSRYTELVRRRGPELLRLAVLLTGSRYDADDALQETILAVSRAWPRITEAAAFSYLRTTLIRKAIDGKRGSIPNADAPDAAVDDPGFLKVDSDQRFFDRVQTLPKQQRAVLVLRYYLDLDDARIAATLGCTRGTVRSQAARGLDKLRAASRTTEER